MKDLESVVLTYAVVGEGTVRFKCSVAAYRNYHVSAGSKEPGLNEMLSDLTAQDLRIGFDIETPANRSHDTDLHGDVSFMYVM